MNEKLMPNCPEQDNEDFKKKMWECCKNLLKQIETKKEQIKQMEYKIDNSEYFDSMIDQKLQKLTELKSRMNSLSQEEKTELYHLEYLNNHRDVLRKNVQEIYKGTIHALKFSWIEELIKTTMLPSFLQVAKTNSDFVNDRYGLDGLLDFTDENAKAVGDFCIDVAIDIAVWVATAWVWELALGAAVKWIQAALKIGKWAMSLKNLKRFLKAEKILRSILAEWIEQTVNISLTNIAQWLKRGKIDQFVSCYDVFNAVCLTKWLTWVWKKMGVLWENLSKRLGEKTKESLQKILDSRIRRGGEGVAKPVGILWQSSVWNLFSELLSVWVDNIKMNDFNTMLNSLWIFVDDKERQELLNSIKKEFQDNLNLETNLTISSPENILRALLKTRWIQQCRKMGLTRAENITSKYQFDAWWSQNKKYQREKNKTQAQQQKEQEKNKKTELSENTLSIWWDNISFVDAENLMIHVGIESMTPAAWETVVSQNEQTPEAELPQVQNQSADSTKVQIPSQEWVSQDSTKVANVPQVQQVLNSNQWTNVNQ